MMYTEAITVGEGETDWYADVLVIKGLFAMDEVITIELMGGALEVLGREPGFVLCIICDDWEVKTTEELDCPTEKLGDPASGNSLLICKSLGRLYS